MRFRLPYWYFLIGPTLMFWLGIFLNAVVVAFNGGKMPVVGPVCSDDPSDMIHTCLTHSTHLKILSDWFWAGWVPGMASPGDFILWGGEKALIPCLVIWAVLVVKKINELERYN